jgi:hypothetical protein
LKEIAGALAAVAAAAAQQQQLAMTALKGIADAQAAVALFQGPRRQQQQQQQGQPMTAWSGGM